MSSAVDYLWVFVIGGLICTVGQLLLSYTRLTSSRILVLFVTMGAVLSAIGVYEPLVEIGKAGATIPLTGFGHSLAQGAIDGARQDGIMGAITGGIRATAGGITAAIVLGYLASVIFTPKTKK